MTRIDPMQWKRATADSTFDTEKATIINVDEKLQLIYCKNDEFAVSRFHCIGSIRVIKYETCKINL